MKINITHKIFLAVFVSVIAFSACTNSPYPGYYKSENGLYSKFYSQDEKGVKPKEGDIVRISLQYFVVKGGKDSLLFDSKDPKLNRAGTTYIEFPLGKSTFKGSFEDALASMAVGDSASFKISADSVYLKTFMVKELPPYIEKGSIMTFETKLLKIISKEEAMAQQQKAMAEKNAEMEIRKNEEGKTLSKYLEDNKIKGSPTATGLYYIESTKGNGKKPKMGDTVKVNYTGRLLDGTIFDTSSEAAAKESGTYNPQRPYEPIQFVLGAGQVIRGWDEGIALMSSGAKGKLIIPSNIAYGETGQGPIPPYAPLIFEVELVSFKSPK